MQQLFIVASWVNERIETLDDPRRGAPRTRARIDRNTKEFSTAASGPSGIPSI
ncbi:hypothetical protein Rhow_001224 [Rhodococcus wratislaviensis]|uniref:Uncharacterized protein n=1 Tax=Rhodococcus wratislaviensis TaxID=44752 RepID=A0A402C3H3_RHOWR|nr:hypothetical protein Rhow_001224 [Rhodococcus wratislaviensis]